MGRRSFGNQAALIALVAASTGLSACGDASGCEDFNPQSDLLSVGESVSVEIEFTDGGWNTPDIAGVYWDSETQPPSDVPQNGSLPGVATLTTAELDAEGNVLEGKLLVELAEFGEFEFIGPITCE